jgi:hypothetical protein
MNALWIHTERQQQEAIALTPAAEE